jgi:PglZ domain-containing protein
MNKWVARQLAPIRDISRGVVVILDQDGLVDPGALDGQVHVIEDWWALRAVYERHGRRRDDEIPPLVLLVSGPLATEALPWDIERSSLRTVAVKLPGPPEVRSALRELDEDEVDRVASAVASSLSQPEAALLGSLTGVHIYGPALSIADQLRLAARLALRARPSPVTAAMARRWVSEPLAAGLLAIPPDCHYLQQAWDVFVADHGGTWNAAFGQMKPEIGALFTAGFLEPTVASAAPAGWPHIGVRRPPDEEQARALLDAAPLHAPEDAAGWQAVAEWWGDVRRLVAAGPTELRDAAWSRWGEFDSVFLPWLRDRYGTLLSSAAPWPSAVHRIAPFLARRLREQAAERVLLIVLDGLGHAQWAHLRDRLDLDVLEAGSTFALVPTYTSVSRQAVFAGDLPASSPSTLWTTHPEERRWKEHWTAEGFNVTGVAYHRVKGRLPDDHLAFGDAPVIGIVIKMVDDLMHNSEVFGDAQLIANLDVWAANGFLVDLIARATAEGIETWITADHGNLECIGTDSVSEGVAIELAGKRLLRYPNLTLREASAAKGIVWDDIPGLPSTAEPLLFAAGRTAFTNNRISVSHGGLSFDEVVVPLARVTA